VGQILLEVLNSCSCGHTTLGTGCALRVGKFLRCMILFGDLMCGFMSCSKSGGLVFERICGIEEGLTAEERRAVLRTLFATLQNGTLTTPELLLM